jgi:hypothetical protein
VGEDESGGVTDEGGCSDQGEGAASEGYCVIAGSDSAGLGSVSIEAGERVIEKGKSGTMKMMGLAGVWSLYSGINKIVMNE